MVSLSNDVLQLVVISAAGGGGERCACNKMAATAVHVMRCSAMQRSMYAAVQVESALHAVCAGEAVVVVSPAAGWVAGVVLGKGDELLPVHLFRQPGSFFFISCNKHYKPHRRLPYTKWWLCLHITLKPSLLIQTGLAALTLTSLLHA